MKRAQDRSSAPQGLQTAFAISLTKLDQRVDWVPIGWQKLFWDLRHALRAVACPKRDSATIEGAYEEDGFLYLDSETPDRVVQGLLRKARTKAKHTCVECGRPGQRRELDNWSQSTLCGSCAGPRLLQLEIRRLLALQRCGTISLAEEVRSSPSGGLVRAAVACLWTPEEHSAEDALKEWLERLVSHIDEEHHR